MSSNIENIGVLEELRRALQKNLDEKKTSAERNKLGQFATPTQLARDILTYGLSLLDDREAVRFLDPAIGTGSFYSALLATRGEREIQSAKGFEIDEHYWEAARSLWRGGALEIELADFTLQTPPRRKEKRSNLLICNPPYVRHHHLSGQDKARLQAFAKRASNMELSGLAGLYCYFMGLSHAWMSDDGIAGWLIPSEFLDVNYGKAIKTYLLNEVTLLHIHRFDPNVNQFDDALVSSAVVWFKKGSPSSPHHEVLFTFGGTLLAPAIAKRVEVRELLITPKWSRFPKQAVEKAHQGYVLGDLFSIKRGLATGDNAFFILDEARAKELDIPSQFLRPILPSSRYIKSDEIRADEDGAPLLEKRLFLVDCNLPVEEVQEKYPALWAYLETGQESVAHGYLCRSRRYWYAQERRPAAPIVCTYMGRGDNGGRPFRFLLNNSKASATNVYLMLYPTPLLGNQLNKNPLAIRSVWEALNRIEKNVLLGNGRVYGGGMYKLEPKELANVPADNLALVVGLSPKKRELQLGLEECSSA